MPPRLRVQDIEVTQTALNHTDATPPHSLEAPSFDWRILSGFRPVRQTTKGKGVEDLCEAFPIGILRDIQPVLKTGRAVLDSRTKIQLQSVSACMREHLLVTADVDAVVDGHQVFDVLADLPKAFLLGNDQLRDYKLQQEGSCNCTGLSRPLRTAHGWDLDKFKFLPQVSRAWRMRPRKKWYVFYEDDTYVVWDNMFRLLANFDPDLPLYLGSPSPGARGTWMANGGPGYILSREAVQRLVQGDYSADGAFVGSKLSHRWEEQMTFDCCGDSVLGLALHEDANTTLSGLFPMIQPHPLHGIPFSDRYWCQPVITMHKTLPKDMLSLRIWEESRREMRRPLLFADLAEYLNLSRVPIREDWDNSDFGGYRAPGEMAHRSFEMCGRACRADKDCLQYTYHLQDCNFVSAIRLGRAMEPGIENWRPEGEKEKKWTVDQRRYMAGWDLDGIQRWMTGEGRDCPTAEWVQPSLERIFR